MAAGNAYQECIDDPRALLARRLVGLARERILENGGGAAEGIEAGGGKKRVHENHS